MEFHDCDDVTLMMDGGSDDAGFVQVIRGKVDDAARLKAMMDDTERCSTRRGRRSSAATLAIEADGTFIETIAFTDEAVGPPRRAGGDARAGTSHAMESAMHDVQLPRPAPPLVRQPA